MLQNQDTEVAQRQFPRVINDIVHRFIKLPLWVNGIMGTSLFMRLQRVAQLGTLSKAWPSATHTRLSHSIGTAHLAVLYSEQLKFTEPTMRAFVVASLLHDIGHGPFSHTFEHVLRAIGDEGLLTSFGSHDDFRIRLLLENAELNAEVKKVCSIDAVISIWQKRDHPTFQYFETPYMPRPFSGLHYLLSGIVGVDRMDYILRDSYMLSPQLTLDPTCIERIMLETRIDRSSFDIATVGYTDEGVRSILIFLDVRRYMYSQVYFHDRGVKGDLYLKIAMTGLINYIRPKLTPDQFCYLTDDFILSFLSNMTLFDDVPIDTFVALEAFLFGYSDKSDERLGYLSSDVAEWPNAREIVLKTRFLDATECPEYLLAVLLSRRRDILTETIQKVYYHNPPRAHIALPSP
jgi:HD superfamily phosphohydrolase